MISASQVIQNITKELGSFFSTEAHSESNMIRYVNSSARKICISKNFKFNKYSYSIVATPGIMQNIPYQIETFFVLNEAGDEVEILDFEEYFLLKDKTDSIGIWEDTFITEKTGTFNIFYKGFPTTITEPTTSINMPEHFYDLLVVGAIYYGYMDIKAYNKANEKLSIFNGFVTDLATRNSDTKPRQIKRLNKSNSTVF